MSESRAAERPPFDRRRGSLALLLWATAAIAPAGAETPEADPFDAIPDLEALVDAVNDGGLRFLPPGSAAGVHAHRNRIVLDSAGLSDGWVRLEQCHENIDAVPAAQVVYHADRIRDLTVLGTENIGQAWVEGPTVQLKDVRERATLCVSGESRALTQLAPGAYRLRNGPHMRKFLDGYYPMRVLLDIAYPPETLRLARFDPARQAGFEVATEPGRIRVDAEFEGRLFTCFDFCAATDPDCVLPEEPCAP
ncbi:MAG: alpha/beta hydrolase [Chromatiaceae bacterium]|jgi:hypothetical protein|nr:alpha/beta hydrolase [Chromatiaceae bacterium]